MTLIGCILLLFSLKPTCHLSQQASQTNWRPLCFLIMAFIIGYSGFLYFLIFHYEPAFIHLMMATILLFGGLFVLMVTRISLNSYENIVRVAKQTEYNALHDSLTGLPNRKHFLTTLQLNIDKSIPFTLFSLDLNHFQQVNYTLGHYYGDQLLVAIAKRLATQLADRCILFRTGGDEFTIVFTDKDHTELIKRIHSAFNDTYQLMHYSIESSVSIGAAKFPEDSTEMETLQQHADVAMYASKMTRQQCVFYVEALSKDASQQLEISGRLKTALAAEEFELYFQPIIVSGSKQVHGAETLIRWPQADGSFISPETFISIAEKSGLITQITEWVIKETIVNLSLLDKQGFTGNLHINLSAKDLQSETLFTLLTKKLNNNEVTADRLILEITESTMMTDLASAKRMMFRLADLGFIFSIDDFGTGFSSLSLLRELPINQIKIDRSFVQKMDSGKTDHAIVKSAIYLAKNLGCSVVAEGVENALVEAALVKLDCDYQQGYHFSKPLPLADFIQTCPRTIG